MPEPFHAERLRPPNGRLRVRLEIPAPKRMAYTMPAFDLHCRALRAFLLARALGGILDANQANRGSLALLGVVPEMRGGWSSPNSSFPSARKKLK
jgi:hypothetical protein